MKKIKISLLQIEGKKLPIYNAKLIKKLLNNSLKFKPNLICLPECSNIITKDKEFLYHNTTFQKDCPVLKECIDFSKKNKVYINIGSLLLKKEGNSKLLNRSFFINRSGKVIKYYDKIHLFDVKINKNEIHKESDLFYSGNKIAYVKTYFGKIGLTICYDLRFPNIFQKLTKKGAKIILVPAAFTVPTGKDHWEILLRSRAIENTSFIVSAAQCGNHHGGRKTYGHSMIINPWGKIIKKGSKFQTIINATINIEEINQIRKKMPSIKNQKKF